MVVERWRLPHHIREHSLARLVQAPRTRNSRAHDGPYRPAASPPPSSTSNSTSAPSESSNTLSTESDLTLSTVSTSRFSIWLWHQHNPVRPPAPTTLDDIVLSRNNWTNSPQTSTQHLRNSVRFQVQDLVDDFEGLDAEARQACINGMQSMPIFPSLYAHVFTHLNLCAPGKLNLLNDLEKMRGDWVSRGSMWCLMNFKAIKDVLSGILTQTQVKLHVCNQSLTGQSRLHALDIQDIGALIASFSTDSHTTSQLTGLKDDKAQSMLDLLQTLLVMKSDQLEEWYKCRFLDIIWQLSRKSGHFPQSLRLRRIDNLRPTSLHGGSASISQGELLGRIVAVKEIRAVGRTTEQFLKDVSNKAVVWYHVQHASCLPFYGIFYFDDGAPRTCLVTPWMKDGNLNAYLQRTDADCAPLILDIARGLEYLHVMQPTIVHGDLKGDNILISHSGRACLANFGVGFTQDSETSYFMAPELVEARGNLHLLDRRPGDIFAFGCICYEMYNRRPLFQGMTAQAAGAKFVRGSRPSRPTNTACLQRGLDDDMWNFIQNLWHQDPKLRVTASQATMWMSYKMHLEGKSTDRPPAEMQWDLGFLTEGATESTDFDPLSLA